MENTTQGTVLAIIDEALSLNGIASSFTDDTKLLGSLAELDSFGVVNILTMIEESFEVVIEDDEISGETFEDVRSLVNFVSAKVDGTI